jgi:hypothetical protein
VSLLAHALYDLSECESAAVPLSDRRDSNAYPSVDRSVILVYAVAGA